MTFQFSASESLPVFCAQSVSLNHGPQGARRETTHERAVHEV
jgi:hypothetical protein